MSNLYQMPDTYEQGIPFLNENFTNVISSVQDFQPRQFTTAHTGARPASGVSFITQSIFSDHPEYNTYASLTQKYDIYIDSGTNATGTVSIDNSGNIYDYNVSIGDYFTTDTSSTLLWIATSSASISALGSGSVSVVAERAGSVYNTTGTTCYRNRDYSSGANIYNYYDSANTPGPLIRMVNLVPFTGGRGGFTAAILTLTASGGAGVENDPNYLWPNGASLSAAQKSISVSENLSITTDLPTAWTNSLASPYTKAFAVSQINIRNNDSNPHSIYVYVSGNIFSGRSQYPLFR